MRSVYPIIAAMLPLALSAFAQEGKGAMPPYEETLKAINGLIAYWPMNDSLTETIGGACDAQTKGAIAYGEGPAGGRALEPSPGSLINLGPTPQLDTPTSTVVFLFKPLASPTAPGNPCIIAKRDPFTETRFSIHIAADLSQVLIWNGAMVWTSKLPEGALGAGTWRHLAVASSEEGLCVYLDGVRLSGFTWSAFDASKKNKPLIINAATPAGEEPGVTAIDELAFFDRVLTQDEITSLASAAGCAQGREALLVDQQAKTAKAEAERKQTEERRVGLLRKRLDDPALFALGETRVYEGDSTGAISLPLGGIGAGCIQINGEGRLAIWQIFNNHTCIELPDSFLGVQAKTAGGESVTRLLQSVPQDGMAGMDSLTFKGEYPFGWYEFRDAALPLRVSMEVFNPLIPMNAKDSAIPCAIMNVTVENTGAEPVEAVLFQSQRNGVGMTDGVKMEGAKAACYGANTNTATVQGGTALLHMTGAASTEKKPGQGEMALAASAPGARVCTAWATPEELQAFLNCADHAQPTGPSGAGETLNGAVAVPLTIAPGEKVTASFVLAWHFPNGYKGQWQGQGVMYDNWWANAPAVAEYVFANMERLTGDTRAYHEALYDSNLPHWLRDRLSSQVAILRSRTCYWTKDNYFGGWEGCCPTEGCCMGNCNHVWHYAQAHARLFPEIAKIMRTQSFRYMDESGAIPHRQPASIVAFDGQCGDILGAYREHLLSKDDAWLKAQWPSIKKAMDYLITHYDADEDGMLTGAQWNTLDGALGGATSWLGSLYIAALDASSRMAGLMGDADTAGRYTRIADISRVNQDAKLWNGSYYIQLRDPEPMNDYGAGCHIDQLLGGWWNGQLMLPRVYPADHEQMALASLLAHNFQPEFTGRMQAPRKFVADEDAGLQMIQWPGEARPTPCILYGDEVMTGFEYSAAATMIQQGMLREGFMVAKAVADRYDGRKRIALTEAPTASWGYSGNPFGDDECGKFYARAMSSWSLLLACQGFIYDGPAGVIGFKPVWRPGDHRSFFTTAEGWGVYAETKAADGMDAVLELRRGALSLNQFILRAPEGWTGVTASASLPSGAAACAASLADGEIRLAFPQSVGMKAGEILRIHIAPA